MATAPELTVHLRVVGLTFVRWWLAFVAWLPEILTALAFVGGWTVLTAGIVALTAPVAWFFSGGLLLISLGGWRLFYIFVRDGLYLLTKQGKSDG